MAKWTDPIVEEIHRYREEYARQFNYDAYAICRDLQRRHEERERKAARAETKDEAPAEREAE